MAFWDEREAMRGHAALRYGLGRSRTRPYMDLLPEDYRFSTCLGALLQALSVRLPRVSSRPPWKAGADMIWDYKTHA
jgi:hypothetical protein